MEYFTSTLNMLGNQPNLTGILQIALDVLILGLIAVLLIGKKRKLAVKDAEVIHSLEKIIEETATISREFGENLEKRQELIRDVTAALDQRIQDARDVCERLERQVKTAGESLHALAAAKTLTPPVPDRQPKGSKSDHQKVLFLANKGLSASEIAKSLKKPLGEVELILSLQKIAS